MSAVGQILFLGLMVTVGDPARELAASVATVLAAARIFDGPAAPASPLTVLLASPGLALLGLHCHRLGGRPAASLAVAGGALLFLVARSYRFPALVATCLFGLSIRHLPEAGRPRRLAWALFVLATLLCVVPVDVSLRVHPSRPHIARAVVGLLTSTVADFEASGEWVVVGGCTSIYNEPRWVWVW